MHQIFSLVSIMNEWLGNQKSLVRSINLKIQKITYLLCFLSSDSVSSFSELGLYWSSGMFIFLLVPQRLDWWFYWVDLTDWVFSNSSSSWLYISCTELSCGLPHLSSCRILSACFCSRLFNCPIGAILPEALLWEPSIFEL